MNKEQRTIEILKYHNLRITSKRKDVLGLIVDYDSAIPFSHIQKELSNFDRVTLYRTMNSLLEKGVIHKIQVEGTEIFYALCGHTCDDKTHQHNHVHFHCSSCEKVHCLEPDSPLNIGLNGFQIENIEIQLQGVCNQCKQ